MKEKTGKRFSRIVHKLLYTEQFVNLKYKMKFSKIISTFSVKIKSKMINNALLLSF